MNQTIKHLAVSMVILGLMVAPPSFAESDISAYSVCTVNAEFTPLWATREACDAQSRSDINAINETKANSQGTDLLAAGAKVRVIERSGDYAKVAVLSGSKLADGKGVGWLSISKLSSLSSQAHTSPATLPKIGTPNLTPMPTRAGRGSGGGSGGSSIAGISVAPSVARSGSSEPPVPVPVGGGATSEGGGNGFTLSTLPSRAGQLPLAEANPDASQNRLYMADVQRRIKRAWFPPKGQESKRVKVHFKIHADGRMEDLRIVESSDSQIADAAALKAVENASPFRLLPPGSEDPTDVDFHFDYNIYNGGGRGSFRQF